MRTIQGIIVSDKSDKTRVIAPSWPEAFEKQILSSTASVSITKGDEFKVSKVEDRH